MDENQNLPDLDELERQHYTRPTLTLKNPVTGELTEVWADARNVIRILTAMGYVEVKDNESHGEQ